MCAREIESRVRDRENSMIRRKVYGGNDDDSSRNEDRSKHVSFETDKSSKNTNIDEIGDDSQHPCKTLITYGYVLLVSSLAFSALPSIGCALLGFSSDQKETVYMISLIFLGVSVQYLYAGRCESNTFAKASVFGRIMTSILMLLSIQCGWLPYRLMCPWITMEVVSAFWTHFRLIRYYRHDSTESYNVFDEFRYALTGHEGED